MASKRLFDIALSSLALLALSPLIAVVAILIRVSSRGPILIRQERVGIDNRPFQMLKFRSMQADAEDATGPIWAAVRDGRRTPVGRLLRRFSLDKLPPLWNVLKGEMSLVGPRPERPVFVTDFGTRIPTYGKRHRVRPGITRWAQVNDLRGMDVGRRQTRLRPLLHRTLELSVRSQDCADDRVQGLTSKNAY